jgi:outer membrane protein OmpA-like peptidoglycan-associated protein
MRWRPWLLAMASGATLGACTGLSSPTATTTSVSPDYAVTGNPAGVRAFIYGKRTVPELPGSPLRLAIQDENGVVVPYEREGRYYRLSRELQRFTVWHNTRILAFQRMPAEAPALAAHIPILTSTAISPALPREVIPGSVTTTELRAAPVAADTPDDDAAAALRLAAAQLDEVRQAIAAGTQGLAEARALHARLDRIEAQLITAATVMVRVQFDTASTAFIADDQLVRTLVPAAIAAQRVNIRGRTDARIAGRNDPGIALGRALAARQFLIAHGVDQNKIKVFALAAGRFLAPPTSNAGRALNRRVEIELVDRRFAALALRARQQESTP